MDNKPKTSTVLIIIICIMIVLYTAANFILQYYTSVEVSPTLTNAWFTFWGTELVALAAIRITKETSKHKLNKKNEDASKE